jgi:hypothetical protein
MWFLIENFVEIFPTSSDQKDCVGMWFPLAHIANPCDAHEMLVAARNSVT